MHYRVSIEVIVPVRASSDDNAIEQALEHLEGFLPDRYVIIESSAAIVEDDE